MASQASSPDSEDRVPTQSPSERTGSSPKDSTNPRSTLQIGVPDVLDGLENDNDECGQGLSDTVSKLSRDVSHEPPTRPHPEPPRTVTSTPLVPAISRQPVSSLSHHGSWAGPSRASTRGARPYGDERDAMGSSSPTNTASGAALEYVRDETPLSGSSFSDDASEGESSASPQEQQHRKPANNRASDPHQLRNPGKQAQANVQLPPEVFNMNGFGQPNLPFVFDQNLLQAGARPTPNPYMSSGYPVAQANMFARSAFAQNNPYQNWAGMNLGMTPGLGQPNIPQATMYSALHPSSGYGRPPSANRLGVNAGYGSHHMTNLQGPAQAARRQQACGQNLARAINKQDYSMQGLNDSPALSDAPNRVSTPTKTPAEPDPVATPRRNKTKKKVEEDTVNNTPPRPRKQGIGLFFSNSAEATQSITGPGFSYPKDDDTVPSTDAQKQEWVRRLYAAFVNMDGIEDKATGPVLNARWKTKDADGNLLPPGSYYGFETIEKVCWDIVELTCRLYNDGLDWIPIHDQELLGRAEKQQDLTFEERMDSLIECLTIFKNRCDKLMKGGDNLSMVLQPSEAQKTARSNRAANDHRQETMVRGRKSKKEEEDAAGKDDRSGRHKRKQRRRRMAKAQKSAADKGSTATTTKNGLGDAPQGAATGPRVATDNSTQALSSLTGVGLDTPFLAGATDDTLGSLDGSVLASYGNLMTAAPVGNILDHSPSLDFEGIDTGFKSHDAFNFAKEKDMLEVSTVGSRGPEQLTFSQPSTQLLGSSQANDLALPRFDINAGFDELSNFQPTSGVSGMFPNNYINDGTQEPLSLDMSTTNEGPATRHRKRARHHEDGADDADVALGTRKRGRKS